MCRNAWRRGGEILHFGSKVEALTVLALAEELPKLSTMRISSQSAGTVNVSVREGVTVQSNTTFLPLGQMMKPVLDEF